MFPTWLRVAMVCTMVSIVLTAMSVCSTASPAEGPTKRSSQPQ